MNKVILMDFYADWCAPCKMQEKIINELKRKFENKIEIKKINVDNGTSFISKYNISAVPTLILEKDGILIKKYVGVITLNVLEKDINNALR